MITPAFSRNLLVSPTSIQGFGFLEEMPRDNLPLRHRDEVKSQLPAALYGVYFYKQPLIPANLSKNPNPKKILARNTLVIV